MQEVVGWFIYAGHSPLFVAVRDARFWGERPVAIWYAPPLLASISTSNRSGLASARQSSYPNVGSIDVSTPAIKFRGWRRPADRGRRRDI
jgi:hypothetical protein